MNQVAAGVSTFRTSLSGKLVPMGVPTAMSPEEQLIAREERAEHEKEIEIEGPTIRLLHRASVFSKTSNPDMCHCHINNQHCHLNVQHPDNGRVLTRSSVCCTSC